MSSIELTEQKKEYIGDAIIHLALALKFMSGEEDFTSSLDIIKLKQSNVFLAQLSQEFFITPTNKQEAERPNKKTFKKQADAVEIHIYDLYIEYGLQFALSYVQKYIGDFKPKTKTKTKK
jgi:hypothetical protein